MTEERGTRLIIIIREMSWQVFSVPTSAEPKLESEYFMTSTTEKVGWEVMTELAAKAISDITWKKTSKISLILEGVDFFVVDGHKKLFYDAEDLQKNPEVVGEELFNGRRVATGTLNEIGGEQSYYIFMDWERIKNLISSPGLENHSSKIDFIGNSMGILLTQLISGEISPPVKSALFLVLGSRESALIAVDIDNKLLTHQPLRFGLLGVLTNTHIQQENSNGSEKGGDTEKLIREIRADSFFNQIESYSDFAEITEMKHPEKGFVTPAQEMLEEIIQVVNFFMVQKGGACPEKLFLSGDWSLCPGLGKWLGRLTSLSVDMDGFKNIYKIKEWRGFGDVLANSNLSFRKGITDYFYNPETGNWEDDRKLGGSYKKKVAARREDRTPAESHPFIFGDLLAKFSGKIFLADSVAEKVSHTISGKDSGLGSPKHVKPGWRTSGKVFVMLFFAWFILVINPFIDGKISSYFEEDRKTIAKILKATKKKSGFIEDQKRQNHAVVPTEVQEDKLASVLLENLIENQLKYESIWFLSLETKTTTKKVATQQKPGSVNTLEVRGVSEDRKDGTEGIVVLTEFIDNLSAYWKKTRPTRRVSLSSLKNYPASGGTKLPQETGKVLFTISLEL